MEEYKGYNIVQAEGNECRFKRIKTIGKGSLPKVLLGLYTTAAEAKKAIDNQQANLKVKSNATKQSSG